MKDENLFTGFTIDEEELKKVQEKLKKKTINRIVTAASKQSMRTEGFIGWLGGKKRVAKYLTSLMPKHTYYIEIFMGSAAVFFEKNKAQFNILNDINKNLVNLYNIVKGNKEEFEKFLYYLYYSICSRDLHHVYKKDLETRIDKLENYKRAAIYYYIILHSFNNDETVKTFPHKFEDITDGIVANIIRSREKLKNVIIENMDYVQLIKKYNQKNKDVLFFADPPYVVADDGKYYAHVFSEDDHRLLAFQMSEVDRKGNYFVITYDDVPLIRELYKNYNIMEYEYYYSSSNTNNSNLRKTELIITNSKDAKQLSLLDGETI
jgi:DNA adenine methylase